MILEETSLAQITLAGNVGDDQTVFTYWHLSSMPVADRSLTQNRMDLFCGAFKCCYDGFITELCGERIDNNL
jgi:hypothetical protein